MNNNQPWYIAADKLNAIESMANSKILLQRDREGHYTDLPDTQEAELLKFLAANPWRDGLRERLKSNPWLAAIVTDPRRSAAVLRVPLHPNSRILDVGSGWGQLTVPLARLGHQVVALDQTPNRLRLVDAIANQEGVACDLFCGDIETAPLKPGTFDLVILNGVLEWTVRNRTNISPATHQVTVLERCSSLLAPNGRIFLAIENALGLKYLMGAREDHCGQPWLGLMDDHQADLAWRALGTPGINARIHDLNGYRQLFARAGLVEMMAWGCFPDYKLPSHVVPLKDTDQFLLGEASWTEYHGDNGTPLPEAWPLRAAYQRLARQGCGAAMAPSYAFLLSADLGK